MTHPSPRGGARRTAVLRTGVALLGLLLVSTTAPADAQTTPTSPNALQLASQTPWVAPTGEFTVRIRRSGLPPDTVLAATVHEAVDGRIRFDRTIRGEDLGPEIGPGPGPVPIAATPALADGSIPITIPVSPTGPAPDGGVVLTRPGVHPVVVTATTPAGGEIGRLVTHLIRLPSDRTSGPSLAVGTVVTLDDPVRPGDAGVPTMTPERTAEVSDVVSTLGEWPAVPLTVDPTPAVLVALDQESTGRQVVAELAGSLTGRQVLAAPYVALDTGSWVADGLVAELDAQLAAGAAVLSRALGTAPDGRTAVADPSLTPEALTRLNNLGLDRLVVPADQLGALPEGQGNVTFTEVFDVTDSAGATIQAITADLELAGRLVTSDDPVLNGHLALADLAVLYNDQPAVNRGVALELGADVDPVTLAVVLAGLTERAPPGSDGRGIVGPVTLDDLFRTTQTATTQTQGRTTTLVRPYLSEPPGTLGDYPAELRSTAREVEGFGSLTEPVPEARLVLDQALLLSGAADLEPPERTGMLDGIRAGIDGITSEIVAPLQQFVTLTSRSGKIPLNLENRSTLPVRVSVVLDSDKLEFPDGSVIDALLPAATTTRLDVQVTTRASGAFPLSVDVRSPDGILEIADTRFTVRSTAISGVGLVLSIGAGLFLLVWWARHFRRTRRAGALVDAAHPSVAAHDDTP